MLERLDEIDWGSLRHGFGEASDTPRWIRDLTADDEGVRASAQGELFGTIWNQGTVYNASAHAVPFLIELLEPPSLADKVGLLCLLACLATGVSELDGETRRLSEGREQAEFDPRLARAQGWVQAAHDAVEAGIPVYLELLKSEDWELRLTAAHVLGTCRRHRAIVAPRLREALANEADERVRFGLLLCLGGVGGVEDALALESVVTDAANEEASLFAMAAKPLSDLIRWAAACALCRIACKEAPAVAVHTLSTCFTAPEPFDEALGQMPWAPEESVSMACEALTQVRTALALSALADGLRGTDEVVHADTLMYALLDVAFPDRLESLAARPHPSRSAGDLDSDQWAALAALVERDEVWAPPSFLGHELSRLGLPASRAEIQELLNLKGKG